MLYKNQSLVYSMMYSTSRPVTAGKGSSSHQPLPPTWLCKILEMSGLHCSFNVDPQIFVYVGNI